MIEPTDPRMFHPHVERNREPILAVLKRLLPARALVLELASGSGQHAAFFARALPGASWLPSDIDSKALASIAAFRTEAAVPNLLAPVRLDATAEVWPVKRASAAVCCNMIHIAPWAACQGLIAGAGRVLQPGGILFLYGPSAVRTDFTFCRSTGRAMRPASSRPTSPMPRRGCRAISKPARIVSRCGRLTNMAASIATI